MTPEPDQISKLINQSPRVKTSLGFAVDDGEVSPREVMQVAVVKGRRRRTETPVGEKNITAQSRLIRTPDGLKAIAGGDGASINVDDLSKLLNIKQIMQVESALHKDRKRRKNNLQGK